jgi:hypothetical protein
MFRIRRTVLVIALLAAATACADDPVVGSATGATGGPSGPTPTGPAPTASGPTATGPTATGPTATGPITTGSEAEIEDGRHFGFIESVDLEALALEFDLAYFLTGEEANAAAEEHGDEVPVPNDYYIVNDNPKLRTLGVAPNLEIVLYDWDRCCDETIEGSLEGLAEAINGGEPVTVDGHLYQGPLSPYWLTVEGGAVTRIEEQYLP